MVVEPPGLTHPHRRFCPSGSRDAVAHHAGAAPLLAYGHTRWVERILGGATRGLLASMTVPVLMAH